MRVRPARSGDEMGLARARVLGWRDGYAGIVSGSVLDGMSIEADVDMWRSFLRDPGPRKTLVIEAPVGAPDGVAGFCTFGAYRTVTLADGVEVTALAAAGTVGEIYALYLNPDYWGVGLGGELMTAAVDALRAEGWREARLWVLEDNVRAQRFYLRHGWLADGLSQPLPMPGSPEEIRLHLSFP